MMVHLYGRCSGIQAHASPVRYPWPCVAVSYMLLLVGGMHAHTHVCVAGQVGVVMGDLHGFEGGRCRVLSSVCLSMSGLKTARGRMI